MISYQSDGIMYYIQLTVTYSFGSTKCSLAAQKLVEAPLICWYLCSIASMFLPSTDSHVPKVRISLSVCYLNAGLKRYAGNKH